MFRINLILGIDLGLRLELVISVRVRVKVGNKFSVRSSEG